MTMKVSWKSAPPSYQKGFSCLAVIIMMFFSGCGVRNANVVPGEPVAMQQFTGKKVSILPVHGDTSMGTDSQLELKKDINEKLDAKFLQILPQSKITGSKTVIQKLNRNRMLDIFDDLSKPYKSVGVFDEKIITSLFNLLKTDFLVISELDNENIDVVAANAYLLSLDILIVNRRNEIVWSGTGDFKQGGMFGLGRVSHEQGAEEIVNLAFAYWTPSYSSTPDAYEPPPVQEETVKPAARRQADPEVQSVQQELNKQGYSAGTADGFMGRKTREALKSYQKDYGLAVTGRADQDTLISLGLREGHTSRKPESVSSATTTVTDSSTVENIDKKPATVSSLTYITTRSVELQSSDDMFADSLLTIPSGTPLDVLSTEGDWYKVQYRKTEGYVMAEFVEQK